MLLPIVLQVAGCLLLAAAGYLWLGLPLALGVAGAATFLAGYAHERGE